MKLMHLSDLHLGKKLNEFSLYDDQKYILQQILRIVEEKMPDCILIAGDIYDKTVPPAEAVTLFDCFLNQLAELKRTVCIISGNHDSAERLSFGAQLMAGSGVYFAGSYDGSVQRVVLQDEYGPVNIYLLPFLKPSTVKHYLDEEQAAQINSYHDAVSFAVKQIELQLAERSVLVAHQFVTGAEPSGSESTSVGGVDNVGAEVFAGFDYVALGHIHRRQSVGAAGLHYAGSPLKYSVKDYAQEKTLTMVSLGAKGDVRLEFVPLKPLRDLHKLRGSFADLMYAGNNDERAAQDFYHITLTDEQEVVDAVQRLRCVYCNLLQLDYDNQRTRSGERLTLDAETCDKQPLELIGDFYRQQNNMDMSDEQQNYIKKLLQQMGGEC